MKKIVLCLFVVLFFTGCIYIPHNKYPYSSGFEVSQNGKLQNPPKDKARIYVTRKNNIFIATLADYVFYYNYEPQFDAYNQPVLKSDYKSNFLARISDGGYAFKDLEPNIPTIITLHTSDFIGGENYTKKYVYFTPKAGRFYCLETSFMEEDSRFAFGFIDLATCEKMIR